MNRPGGRAGPSGANRRFVQNRSVALSSGSVDCAVVIGDRDRPGRRAVRLAPPFLSDLHSNIHTNELKTAGNAFHNASSYGRMSADGDRCCGLVSYSLSPSLRDEPANSRISTARFEFHGCVKFSRRLRCSHARALRVILINSPPKFRKRLPCRAFLEIHSIPGPSNHLSRLGWPAASAMLSF